MIFSRLLRLNSARLACSVLCILAFLCLSPSQTIAFDEFDYDVRLIPRLAEVGMKSYALLHMQNMMQKYPDHKDHIYYAKARFHYKLNERRQGEEAVSMIPMGSPFYIESQLIMAEEALRKGQLEAAEEAYKKYFQQVQKPASTDPMAVEAFQKAATYYAQVQIEKGDGAKAAEILGYLKNIEGDAAPEKDQMILTVARAVYQATEVREDRGEPIDKELVKKQIKILEEIQWRHTGYELITIESFIQMARGYIYLGEYEQALKTLKIIGESAAVVAEQVPPEQSPLPAAFFYYARIFDEMARKSLDQGKREDAAKKIKIAANFYNDRLIKAFPKSGLLNKALLHYGKMSELAKNKLELTLPKPVGMGDTGFPVLVEAADRFYDVQEYEKAADKYLEAMRMARLNPSIPELALRLVFCLGETNRLLEATAIASYLADVFPDSEQAALALLQTGQRFFAKAKNMDEGEKKNATTEKAFQAWSTFVEVAPQHPNAADIAFLMAEFKYAAAEKVVKQAGETKEIQEKEKLKEQARELFADAIPAYERIVELFPTTQRGVRALYKLAWIYYNINENKKAAESFLQYVRRETDPKRNRDRVQAKFYAAEQLMFSNTPSTAVPHFQELLTWFKNDSIGPNVNYEGAERIKENAANYIGWSYDLSAEQLRPQLNEFNDAIKLLENKNIVVDERIERAANRRNAAVQSRKQIDAERDEYLERVDAPIPDPEARALQQAMPPQDELAKVTDEQRQQMIANAKIKAGEIAIDFRRQDVDNLQGEIANWERSRKEAARKLNDLKAEQEKRTAELEVETRNLEKAVEESKQVKQYLLDLVEPIEEARKKIALLEQDVENLREKFKTAVQTGREAKTDRERRDASKTAANLREQGQNALTRLEEAKERLQKLQRTDYDRQVAELKKRKTETQKEIEALEQQVEELASNLAVVQQDAVVAEAEIDACNAMIELNRARLEIVKENSDKRNEMLKQTQVAEKAETTKMQWEKVRDAKLQRAQLVIAQAEQSIKKSADQKQQRKDDIQQLQAKAKPVHEEIIRRKEKALTHFLQFLKDYDASKYVPSIIARVGSIYLEKKDYAKAAEYLNELVKRFPEAEVTTNAIFDLGRAQFEIGKTEDAVATFKQLKDKLAEQKTNNLSFMARAMMESGQSDFAVQACEELLRRARNPNHKDRELLYGEDGKMYERLLYRTAVAALDAKMFDKVVEYSDELLKINERTAYFFELKMALADAKRKQTPPDYQGAVDALTEVLRFAQDANMKNQALVELGETYMMMNDQLGETAYRKALGQFGQIALVTIGGEEDVVLLADPKTEAGAKFIQQALYKSAVCYAVLGDEEKKQVVADKYRELFPAGEHLNELTNLPPAKF